MGNARRCQRGVYSATKCQVLRCHVSYLEQGPAHLVSLISATAASALDPPPLRLGRVWVGSFVKLGQQLHGSSSLDAALYGGDVNVATAALIQLQRSHGSAAAKARIGAAVRDVPDHLHLHDGRRTHDARLACNKQCQFSPFERPVQPGELLKRDHLGVRGGVAALVGAVGAGGHDGAVGCTKHASHGHLAAL
ncbi:hypothetical protein FGB62_69g236 [Gracilaria domingensis]|nr:hypothetical protein FGB62_69g236 [Gracilaria domingensis]